MTKVICFNFLCAMLGGANPVSDDSKDKGTVVNTVWSFDPITRTWYRENSMITPRKNFGFVVSHMKLYAIGGQGKNGRFVIHSKPTQFLISMFRVLNSQKTKSNEWPYSRKTPLNFYQYEYF